jgi:hypothetical protein
MPQRIRADARSSLIDSTHQTDASRTVGIDDAPTERATVRATPERRRFRLTPVEQERYERALAVIDALNSADPTWLWVQGGERPKALAEGELATAWLEILRPYASLELRLAARAHHLRRWMVRRDSYPDGRAGYLRWRNAARQLHAEQVGIVLAGERYPEDTILRVQALVRKRGLGHDAETQALEDALCLIFMETQLDELAAKTPPDKMQLIIRRAVTKMSDLARRLATSLPLSTSSRALLDQIDLGSGADRIDARR